MSLPVKWEVVKARCERGLTGARAALESVDCTHEEAMHLRGKIAAYREVLALADPPLQPNPLPGFG